MNLPLTLWAQLYLYPLIAVFCLWGGLTVGLLWLNRRGARPAQLVLLLTIPLLIIAHHQMYAVRHDLSIIGAYQGVVAGMLIWTWHELAFYSGVLTGPWRAPCPPAATGWRRFGYALSTHLYHEAAVIVEFCLLGWIALDAGNVAGPWTFALLWALQHSAKLNVLLGARSLHVDALPVHLRYLGSFWTQRPSNPFFLPAVMTASVLALILWIAASLFAIDEPGRAVGLALLATLTTLGILEHWLLVLPMGNLQPANVKVVPPAKPDISRLNIDS
ncbi:MAG: DUF3623 family protein [Chloroflexaceae bacterium]|nr:DUF3623 family protein [Chloroflexaceae bacterium]NJO05839.1 DUF3623 family protein [Chloroflexaceae bacterium]